ncbi:MAG: major facilitator superfamily protein [Devosia sp.]|uniref:arsenite efflux MFS transporter ArsK n=1 Tax=Devosia sp. TaxID=1871048 RepID=UPI0026315962|nr:arsenite efflux MFS transporter ArsK [Devosia sp.]MDB5529415.1 major facilitator superfamily protein [Devosia sp.]
MTRDGRELGPTAIVWLLGVSQILGYGTLYYSFSILAEDVAGTFGWPVSWLYGSFSLALLAGGLVAPVVGRRIDRHGGGAVMAAGSVLAAATLLAASLAPNPWVFSAAVIAMQASGSLVLYDAAFAVLVQTTGAGARLRITHLTLIAGFASTIFWPLTSWLHGVLDWRAIMIGFAAVNLAICLPIHLLIAGQHRRSRAAALTMEAPPAVIHDSVMPPLVQRRVLWLVTGGFALAGFTLSAVLNQMVPMLAALGLGTSALVVSTLFGPAQVLVRLVNMLIGLKRHPMPATLIAIGIMPIAILILLLTAPLAAGAVVFAILLGFSSGLKSIVQGTLPLALFGSASYGARLGWMAFARQVLAAAAPFVLAWLTGTIGLTYALAIITGVAALGFLAFVEVARLRQTHRPGGRTVVAEEQRSTISP